MVAEQSRKTQGRRRGRLLLLALVAALIGAYVAFDLGQWLSLERLASVRQEAQAAIAAHPLASAGAFFVVYVAVAALSLPGAAVMTLAGGALFGFGWGLLLVSFASSVGATLAMLISRGLLRDWVQSRFGAQLASINAGLARDGGFYLFSIRMVPLFPFFVVNLVMGLTPLSARTFYWVSQIGMLPGTAVYVLAGTELARIDSLAGILSPGLVLAFTLLGLFPLLARKATAWLQARRASPTEIS
jgi:uncharacterized membrane protein YdjX (TVP38/TMEM64 family)